MQICCRFSFEWECHGATHTHKQTTILFSLWLCIGYAKWNVNAPIPDSKRHSGVDFFFLLASASFSWILKNFWSQRCNFSSFPTISLSYFSLSFPTVSHTARAKSKRIVVFVLFSSITFAFDFFLFLFYILSAFCFVARLKRLRKKRFLSFECRTIKIEPKGTEQKEWIYLVFCLSYGYWKPERVKQWEGNERKIRLERKCSLTENIESDAGNRRPAPSIIHSTPKRSGILLTYAV